jgi:hypothetical protein
MLKNNVRNLVPVAEDYNHSYLANEIELITVSGQHGQKVGENSASINSWVEWHIPVSPTHAGS